MHCCAPSTSWSTGPVCPRRPGRRSNETLEVRQLLDLVFTVGAYDTLAMAFRSFGVELDADLSGNELVVAWGPEPDVLPQSTGAPP